MQCPRYHRFINGTIVSRNDTLHYPYDAYKYWCMPWECEDKLDGEPTCDPYSNPMQQSILKLGPHKEWGYHGFPSETGQGWINDTRLWTLNVGNLLSRLYFSCQKPNVSQWTTFNIGPEAGIGDWRGYSNKFQWDITQFDIIAPK